MAAALLAGLFCPPLSFAVAAPPSNNQAATSSVIGELKKRRIIAPDAEDYTEEDLETLARMRKAESLGGVDFLSRKLGNIEAFTYEERGKSDSPVKLNKAGFEKYLFFLSQKAIAYFALHHVKPKRVFNLTDIQGRKIFDKNGLLTLPGENLFNQILEKRHVKWELSGKTMANYNIKKSSLTSP